MLLPRGKGTNSRRTRSCTLRTSKEQSCPDDGFSVIGALAFLLVGLVGRSAWAQPPVKDFGELPSRVRVGDTVWLMGDDGREEKGKLWALSASSLEIMAKGQAKAFKADNLRAVWARDRDSLANGALIGMGTGVALAALAANVCDDYLPCFAVAGAVYGGLGAAIGMGIDAITPGSKIEIYRRSPVQSARVRLAPFVSPRTQAAGALVRIAF